MATGKIFTGSDHAGLELKKELVKLLEEKYDVEDMGPYRLDEDDDYPDYAEKVCKKVLEKKGMGILICGSGQGMCMAANKFKGIRAALCWDEESAKVSREHLDANVMCIGSRFVALEQAKRMVNSWVKTSFSGEKRHLRRIIKISRMENSRS